MADAGPSDDSPTVWTIVVAAGGGSRFGAPKQYEPLGDERVLDRAVGVARQVSIDVVIVVPASDAQREGGVAGGSTRSASVRAGLARVPVDVDIVCVHDAARPLATPQLFEAVVGAVRGGADAAVPAVPVTDTIKVVDEAGFVVDTPDRSRLVAVQTPQAFRAAVLRRAHEAEAEGTDDAALVERAGGVVATIAGEALNRKITTQEDLEWARRCLAASMTS